MAGIYIHIPFCKSFCSYCGFYSECVGADNAGTFGAYIEALEREILRRHTFFSKSEKITTLYFGGGTPSVLPPEIFEAIVDCLDKSFDLSDIEEFTVEVNPDDIVSGNGVSLIEAYRKCGVDRISMGVQATQECHLEWMNRRHRFNDVEKAFFLLRNAGFENISLDLIFGYRGLTESQWSESLDKIVLLDPEHISAYQLSIDAESVLAEKPENQSVLPEEQCAAQYFMLQRRLKDAGYIQYEISNFAKPSRQAKHNSNYWRRVPYLGLGPSAHSFDGNRCRSWNVADLEKYCAGEDGQEEILSEKDILNEKIMLGLRTCEGVPYELLENKEARFLKPLVQCDGRYIIPEDKYFVCDNIITDLFA